MDEIPPKVVEVHGSLNHWIQEGEQAMRESQAAVEAKDYQAARQLLDRAALAFQRVVWFEQKLKELTGNVS
jgi:hypothetical protein